MVFHCTDDAAGQVVATQAGKRVGDNLQYSHTEFLAVLDRLGSDYDWVRLVVAEPTPQGEETPEGPHIGADTGLVLAGSGYPIPSAR